MLHIRDDAIYKNTAERVLYDATYKRGCCILCTSLMYRTLSAAERVLYIRDDPIYNDSREDDTYNDAVYNDRREDATYDDWQKRGYYIWWRCIYNNSSLIASFEKYHYYHYHVIICWQQHDSTSLQYSIIIIIIIAVLFLLLLLLSLQYYYEYSYYCSILIITISLPTNLTWFTHTTTIHNTDNTQ